MTGLLGGPVQIAYAVPDVEVYARRWASSTGAGPFFVRPHIAVTDVTTRVRSPVMTSGLSLSTL